MNKYVVVGLAACMTLAACGDKGSSEANASSSAVDSAAVQLESDDQKASYAIGLRYGEGFGRDLKELDLQAFQAGMMDGFKGNEPKMSQEELVATLQALQARKMKEQQEAQSKVLEENAAAGEAFLEENKAREGVTVTESGLQYEVLEEGDGATPGVDDKVKVHYHGTLPDGTVFDSSVERGEPITFAVNGVIKGWTEALQLMQVGDKWKIVIPSDLAYGERGAGAKIGPNQVLMFEVELLDIVKDEVGDAEATEGEAEAEAAAE